MATVPVSEDQNIFDLALQLYGSTEAVFQIMADNGLESLQDYLETGQAIEYTEQTPTDFSPEVALFFRNQGITINTGDGNYSRGIGQMTIGFTFTVS